jgi:hypothetical protein
LPLLVCVAPDIAQERRIQRVAQPTLSHTPGVELWTTRSSVQRTEAAGTHLVTGYCTARSNTSGRKSAQKMPVRYYARKAQSVISCSAVPYTSSPGDVWKCSSQVSDNVRRCLSRLRQEAILIAQGERKYPFALMGKDVVCLMPNSSACLPFPLSPTPTSHQACRRSP